MLYSILHQFIMVLITLFLWGIGGRGGGSCFSRQPLASLQFTHRWGDSFIKLYIFFILPFRKLAEEELMTNIAQIEKFQLPSGQEIELEDILVYLYLSIIRDINVWV